MAKTVSVVIPLFDEEESVDRALPAFVDTLRSSGGAFEVLLVNDGSTDETEARARRMAERMPHVRVLNHSHNRGKGAALKTGLLAASGDLVFCTDGDLPAHPDCLRRFRSALGDADVVVGYWSDRRESLRRTLFSAVYQGLLRRLFRIDVRNVNCPAKLWRRDAVRQIAERMRARSVFVDAEMLLGARRRGLRVVECPVRYTPRTCGRSKLGTFRSAIHTLTDLSLYLLGRRPCEAR
jgi:glycosyltransferase involved in cell wall biosynthesis